MSVEPLEECRPADVFREKHGQSATSKLIRSLLCLQFSDKDFCDAAVQQQAQKGWSQRNSLINKRYRPMGEWNEQTRGVITCFYMC
ncbi:unnamed protein product [Linum tenue]|uniref:Uncharacterized protein n=1 Tax=Linum tenue TaxID=586396 RepID=A0AAV0PMX8_9ROSI|nr:unnamed protein product [Linum tenue]CAI0471900.1 unnamed protein product [Linum tenue]